MCKSQDLVGAPAKRRLQLSRGHLPHQDSEAGGSRSGAEGPQQNLGGRERLFDHSLPGEIGRPVGDGLLAAPHKPLILCSETTGCSAKTRLAAA